VTGVAGRLIGEYTGSSVDIISLQYTQSF